MACFCYNTLYINTACMCESIYKCVYILFVFVFSVINDVGIMKVWTIEA